MRNAADPKQVGRASQRVRDSEAAFLGNLRAVMDTPHGRAVMWELVSRAGVYRSIWHPNVEIHYAAGQQDYGHKLLADLVAADETLYELMEREARARLRRDDATTDATHTEAATDKGEQR